MFLAEILSGGQLITLSMVLIAGVLLWRLQSARRKQSRQSDSLHNLQTEIRRYAASPEGRLNNLEVRLHDFARDVEGRIQSRLLVLDQLILDADREIIRLQDVLSQCQGTNRATRLPMPVTSQRHPDLESAEGIVANVPDHARLFARPKSIGITGELLRSTVADLSNRGFTADQIASATQVPIARIMHLVNQHRAGDQSDAA